MQIELQKRNKIIRDAGARKAFAEFDENISGVIGTLYQQDDLFFIALEPPKSNSLLSEPICLKCNSASEIKTVLSEFACNVDMVNGGNVTARDSMGSVSVEGEKSFKLTSIDRLAIDKEGKTHQFLSGNNLSDAAEKITDFSEIGAYAAGYLFANNNPSIKATDEQLHALKYYQEEGYEFINSFMRDGDLKLRGNLEKETVNVDFCKGLLEIDALFDKAPPLEKDMVSYRGGEASQLDNDSFVSTSLSKSFSRGLFAKGAIYKITIPKGTHVLNIGSIENLKADMRPEAEMLLRPCIFNINKETTEDKNKIYDVNMQEKSFPDQLLKALHRRKEEYLKRMPKGEADYQSAIEYVSSFVTSRDKPQSKTQEVKDKPEFKAQDSNLAEKIQDLRRLRVIAGSPEIKPQGLSPNTLKLAQNKISDLRK